MNTITVVVHQNNKDHTFVMAKQEAEKLFAVTDVEYGVPIEREITLVRTTTRRIKGLLRWAFQFRVEA